MSYPAGTKLETLNVTKQYERMKAVFMEFVENLSPSVFSVTTQALYIRVNSHQITIPSVGKKMRARHMTDEAS